MYGAVANVKTILDLSGSSEDARIARLLGVFSDLFDKKTGATANSFVSDATVAYAVEYTAARQYRAEGVSNEGQLGPDGFVLRTPAAIPNAVWDAAVALRALAIEEPKAGARGVGLLVPTMQGI